VLIVQQQASVCEWPLMNRFKQRTDSTSHGDNLHVVTFMRSNIRTICMSCVTVLTCLAARPLCAFLCLQNMFEDWLSHQVGTPTVGTGNRPGIDRG
jgi:hypothetical protein